MTNSYTDPNQLKNNSIAIADEVAFLDEQNNGHFIEYIEMEDVLDDMGLEKGSYERSLYKEIIGYLEDNISKCVRNGLIVSVPMIGNVRYKKPFSTSIEVNTDYLNMRIREHVNKTYKKIKTDFFKDYMAYKKFESFEYAAMYITSLCLMGFA